MTIHNIRLLLVSLYIVFHSIACAGPKVAPHPNAGGVVKVSNKDYSAIYEFKEAKDIALFQGIFLRAKKVGNTRTHLKKTTHKINFSDSWLVDMNTGEAGVLSKTHMPVYRIAPKDLKVLKKLLDNKAEQVGAPNPLPAE